MGRSNRDKDRLFDCPSCGNPLKENTKNRIRCPYCRTIIVPKSRKLHREEAIYEKKYES